MIKTVEQIKALLRVTPLSERLDLLTEIYLESDDEKIMRFTEGYRWAMGASDRRKTKEILARLPGKKEASTAKNKEISDEVYDKECFDKPETSEELEYE
jgi:hypothetical protein